MEPSTGPREVLFLAHRLPFPPDRGDRIRSWHVLQALARRAPVHLGALLEGDEQPAHREHVAALAQSLCLAPRPPLPLAGLVALARHQPVSLAAFASARLARWVRSTLQTRPIDAIFVFSGQMAPYVPADFAGRVVMDFVDVDSAKYAAYAQRGGARRWIDAREARLLRAFEGRVARRVDHALFVSAAERALFLDQHRDVPPERVVALGNGIDAATFAPGVAPVAAPGAPCFVFTGQMDYAPNEDAVARFARAVMPAVRMVHPAASFAIVGRAPTPAVRALEGVNGTRVIGAVADVRPWLAAADCVVAPLRIARGVQNKVLEAMAMARPVLLTPEAATGIDARDGIEWAVAGDDAALARRALALLADPAGAAAMGTAARAHVLSHAAWDRMLAPLDALMGWSDAA